MLLLHHILKCNHFGMSFFGPIRFAICVNFQAILILLIMRNNFPKRSSDAKLHTLSEFYNVPVGFVTLPPHLKKCIALFAVFEE